MPRVSINYPKPKRTTFHAIHIGHAFLFEGLVYVKTSLTNAVQLHNIDKDKYPVVFNHDKLVLVVASIDISPDFGSETEKVQA